MDKDTRDPVRDIEAGYYRGEAVKAFKRGAGIDQEPSVQASEKTSLDVAAIFKAQTDLFQNTLNQLTELRNANQTTKTDSYLQHLEGDLQEMKQRLNAPGQDPMEALIQSTTRLQAFTQLMKDHLGIPTGVQAAPSDIPRLIELERTKQDGEERRRQWEAEREELRHQWDKEDRRWMEEFKLKRLQFAEDRQTRNQAMSALQDLAGSVVDGIDAEREGGETVGGPGQVRKPKSFRCITCGAVVRVSGPDAIEAMCDSCGEIFDLVERTEGVEARSEAKTTQA